MKKVLAVCGSPDDWKPDASLPYEEALSAAGIEPLLIRPADPIPPIYSGLLLMGGTDVDPSLYGAPHHPECEHPDHARDRMEMELIAEALRNDAPVLAICRGLQILNVQHGGTLIQHLETTERHRRRTPDKSLPAHQVSVEPGSTLAEIAGPSLLLDVNSRHHQAVALVGADLHVTARAREDGVIEALERRDRKFVVGVQWHPENQIRTDPREFALFQRFAAAL